MTDRDPQHEQITPVTELMPFEAIGELAALGFVFRDSARGAATYEGDPGTPSFDFDIVEGSPFDKIRTTAEQSEEEGKTFEEYVVDAIAMGAERFSSQYPEFGPY